MESLGELSAIFEVLSVVSTQYKSVLDAIRANSKTFLFVDEEGRRRIRTDSDSSRLVAD